MPQPVQPIAGEPSSAGTGHNNKGGKPQLIDGGRTAAAPPPENRSFPLTDESDEEQRDMNDLVPSPREQPRYAAAPTSPSPRSRQEMSMPTKNSESESQETTTRRNQNEPQRSPLPARSLEEEDDDDGMEFSAWDSPAATTQAQPDAGQGGARTLQRQQSDPIGLNSSRTAAVDGLRSEDESENEARQNRANAAAGRAPAPPPLGLATRDRPKIEFSATTKAPLPTPIPPPPPSSATTAPHSTVYTFSSTPTGRLLTAIAGTLLSKDRVSTHSGSALAGFLSLLLVTCANYVLSPMRDAAALAIGVSHIPHLTLASTFLALASSVPVGWLFEAPNPERGGLSWRRRVGLTRGETQGTSLALFYRVFAIMLVGYAAGFKVKELLVSSVDDSAEELEVMDEGAAPESIFEDVLTWPPSLAGLASVPLLFRALLSLISSLLSQVANSKFGKLFYVAFFLVVHLMKLHSLSLIWGVASEAMEYEERAEKREKKRLDDIEQEKRDAAAAAAKAVVLARSDCGDGLSPLPAFKPPPTMAAVAAAAAQQEEKKEDLSAAAAQTGLRRRKKHAPKLRSIPSGEAIGGGRPEEDSDSDGSVSKSKKLSLKVEAQLEKSVGSGGAASAAPAAKEGKGSGDGEGASKASQKHGGLNPVTTRSRLRRLAFVGLGGTIGGILGSVIASAAAGALHLSGLLLVAAVLLEFSAELSVELGRIMLRHWEEEQLALLEKMAREQRGKGKGHYRSPSKDGSGNDELDSSMKRVRSLGSMKRIASGGSLAARGAAAPAPAVAARALSESSAQNSRMRKAQSSITLSAMAAAAVEQEQKQQTQKTCASVGEKGSGKAAAPSSGKSSSSTTSVSRSRALDDSNSFKQRLLRGVTTILRSRLLMCIFTYNALAATTTVLLSFQRAELVANRSAAAPSAERDTAFLAKVNMASSVAVFALQASGAGALMSDYCGRYGTLALMPMVRMCGVAGLAWWHVKGSGRPPNLTLFLVLDEFAKVMNFAVAKPVRESLWRGLSNEARYEAKPIVDTLANRWGGGSAAFLMSFFGMALEVTGWGRVSAADGTRTVLGFPPVLILCAIAAVWWAAVSVDLGNIRRRIDLELKKHQ